jgi:hypothetical protein
MNRIKLAAVVLLAGIGAGSCTETGGGPVDPLPASSLLPGPLNIVLDPLKLLDPSTEATIGAEGGRLEIAGGHWIDFPAGALAETTTITAVHHALRLAVEFGPQGLTFPAEAPPTLNFRLGALLLPGIAPQNLFVVYFDDYGNLVEILPTELDLAAGVVRAPLRHFSTYALATDRSDRGY